MRASEHRVLKGLFRKALAITAAVCFSAAFCMSAFAESLPGTVLKGGAAGPGATGWLDRGENGWSYYLNGSQLKGVWAEVDGCWYHFGDDGVMQTGWAEADGRWFYLGENGVMQTGWVTVGEDEYYLAEEGDETHPKGSLYVKEKTPDGTDVDANGAKVKIPAIGDRPNPYGYSCVEVSISEQMVYCYINDSLVWMSPCVSGRSGSRATKIGHHKINSKERNRYLQGTNSDGSRYKSWVNYWMPFYGGQGLHDASWRSSFGGTIYVNSGSHGCVNLPRDAAAALYNIVWVGMPVIVHQ